MKGVFLLIAYAISSVSLILFPVKLTCSVSTFISYIFSYRFKILSKIGGRLFIRYPFFVLGYKYITIGQNFSAGKDFRIECWDNYAGEKYTPSIVIGDNVSIGYRCHIGAINGITIKDSVLIGSNVLIMDHSHGKWGETINLSPIKRPLYSKGKIVIEENVWIGDNVAILPNVKIGKGSIVGANAVVINDIPNYSLAVGNPAKIVKTIM